MPTSSPIYGSPTTINLTLASLASDAGLSTGRTSESVDNIDGLLFVDCLVGGKVTLGTSPTGGQVEIWLYGAYNGDFSGGATGANAGLTPDHKALLKLLVNIWPIETVTNKVYRWGPYSVANAFGGFMPSRWGVWIVHGTGVNLNATAANHEVVYIPVRYES
jgi:hypothetical protein